VAEGRRSGVQMTGILLGMTQGPAEVFL